MGQAAGAGCDMQAWPAVPQPSVPTWPSAHPESRPQVRQRGGRPVQDEDKTCLLPQLVVGLHGRATDLIAQPRTQRDEVQHTWHSRARGAADVQECGAIV